MTLAESAAIEQKKLRKGVLLAFYQDTLPSPVERVPFEDVESLNVPVAMLAQADAPTLRLINEAPQAWDARFDQFSETLKVIENTLVHDPVVLMQKNLVVDPRQQKITAYQRQLQYLVNELLINGDPSSDPRNPAGLLYRLDNEAKFAGQTVDCSQAGPVGLNVDASDANRLLWLDYIDDGLYRIDGGNPTFFAMNRQTHLKFRSALRALKMLDTTKDQFDREITSYRGVPFLDTGPTAAASLTGATQVIADDTETAPSAATNTTSMYAVKTGSDHFMGLQMGGGLDVRHFGEATAMSGTTLILQDVTRFRWVLGFYTGHPRCIVRVCGLDIS